VIDCEVVDKNETAKERPKTAVLRQFGKLRICWDWVKLEVRRIGSSGGGIIRGE
jgi:hypothetical protein